MKNSNLDPIYNRYAQTKIREQTKVREILQQVALLGLERQGFFEKAAFYGGTALRILYGLDRFSEDLDFTLLQPDKEFDFSTYLKGMQQELLGMGYNLEVTKKYKGADASVQSAFMKGNSVELYLKIGENLKPSHPEEKIQIKLEIDVDPPCTFKLENRLVLNPTTFYVLSLSKSNLFAGKMAAVLYRSWQGRVKGRDWYDLVWYIQNQVPIDLDCLAAYMRQNSSLKEDEPLSLPFLVKLLHQKIDTLDFNAAKADMRTFIPDPEKLDIWTPHFFKELLEHMKTEK